MSGVMAAADGIIMQVSSFLEPWSYAIGLTLTIQQAGL
jgi:hypothetical protein